MDRWMMTAVLLVGMSLITGCGDAGEPKGKDKKVAQNGEKKKGEKKAEEKKEEIKTGAGHEWWCDEHGVPEEVCGQCSSKLAAEFQKKGDWCKDHDRPDSQCFLCHPELEAKFAAQYEAKYGKQPPKPKG